MQGLDQWKDAGGVEYNGIPISTAISTAKGFPDRHTG